MWQIVRWLHGYQISVAFKNAQRGINKAKFTAEGEYILNLINEAIDRNEPVLVDRKQFVSAYAFDTSGFGRNDSHRTIQVTKKAAREIREIQDLINASIKYGYIAQDEYDKNVIWLTQKGLEFKEFDVLGKIIIEKVGVFWTFIVGLLAAIGAGVYGSEVIKTLFKSWTD